MEYEQVREFIDFALEFFRHPNKNGENFSSIIRALMKDILELDAGVVVKTFTPESYDWEQLEPKSGSPVLKPMGQRQMVEIKAYDGASFLKETDKFGYVAGYWQYSYQIPAHPMWFNKDEVVYVTEQPRSMSTYGFARTQAIMDVIKSLHYSTLYNKRYFEESAMPDGVLGLKETSEPELKIFRDDWNREFRASPHKFAVTNKEIVWQPIGISNKELEFLETQKSYFKWVIAMFGLTPNELGMTDDMNRSTSATQSEVVKRKGIRPFLKLLEQAINNGIIAEFGMEGIEFTFIYDDPVEKAQKLDNYEKEIRMGLRTPNEVRKEMGLEPLPGGDNPPGQLVGDPNRDFGKPGKESPEEGKAKEQSDNERKQEGKNNEAKKSLSIFKKEMNSVQQMAMEHGVRFEQLMLGIEVEREHSATVANDEGTIIRIALDHLKEDPEYYTKLDEMESKGLKEDLREFKNEIFGELANEIYRILIMEGLSPMIAARISARFRQRMRKNKIIDAAEGTVNYITSALASGNTDRMVLIEELIWGGMSDEEVAETVNDAYARTNLPKISASWVRDYKEQKNMLKGYVMPVGQYYNDQPIAQPRRNYDPVMFGMFPEGEMMRTPNMPKIDWNKEDTMTCPYCGYNSLQSLKTPDQVGQVEGSQNVRCLQCGAVMDELEVMDASIPKTIEANPHEHAQGQNPFMPKGLKKNKEITVKEFIGFEYEKAMPEIEQYIDGPEYKKLLKEYLSDLGQEKLEGIKNVLREAIKEHKSLRWVENEMFKLIQDPVRASAIARTELIRVSNEGNLNDIDDAGIKKVKWITMPEYGKVEVCEECKKNESKNPYTLKTARGMIPVHPNCRCTFVEYFGEYK